MFGNKYAGDELAKEFYKTLNMPKITNLAEDKEESEEETSEEGKGEAEEVEMEEAEEADGKMEEVMSHLKALEEIFSESGDESLMNLLKEMQSSMSSEEEEEEEETEEDSAESFLQDEEDDDKEEVGLVGGIDEEISDLDSMAKDHEMMDAKAAEIFSGLGKIAGSLRRKGEFFMSDTVEATALLIKKDLIKEASQKLSTINTLKKVASSISRKGDQFTVDVVLATIEKIKKG